MSYFILYLCSIASNLCDFFNFIGDFFIGSYLIYSVIIIVITLADEDSKHLKNLKTPLKWVAPLVFNFYLLEAIIPSTKECYAIFGIGATLEYVQNNKELNKIPDNAFKAINYYLESIPEDSVKTN